MKKIRHYVLMPNSKEAMTLYQKMQEAQIKSTVAPTPREADHCCGVCILYNEVSKKDKILEIAKKNDLEIDCFWDMENKDDPNRNKFC